MEKTTENKTEKIKVTEAYVIAEDKGVKNITAGHGRYYFSIMYKEVGARDYSVGWSSYSVSNVFYWLEENFEIVKEEQEIREHIDVEELNGMLDTIIERMESVCNILGLVGRDTITGTLKHHLEIRLENGVVDEYEYVENARVISESDLMSIDCISGEYEYIARDKYGRLFVYDGKPTKLYNNGIWISRSDIGGKPVDALILELPMVKWEDEQAWEIEELRGLNVVGNY